MRNLILVFMVLTMSYSCSNSQTTTETQQASEGAVVYVCVSKSSVAYHSSRTCSYLKQCTHDVDAMSREDAIAAGKHACSRCYHSSSKSDNSSSDSDEDTEDAKPEGTHSATVEYTNPNTGYSATYTLDVEVENNQVTQIDFPNGGYLDEDHITPADIEDGKAHVEGEDGKTYDVEIDD